MKKEERVPDKLEETPYSPTTASVPLGKGDFRDSRAMPLYSELVSESKGALSQMLNLKVLVLSLMATCGVMGVVIIGLVSSFRQVHSPLAQTNELAVELNSQLSFWGFDFSRNGIMVDGGAKRSHLPPGHSQDNDVQGKASIAWGSQLEPQENDGFLSRSVPWLVVEKEPLIQVLKPILVMLLVLIPVIAIVLFLLYDILHFNRLRLCLPLRRLRKVMKESFHSRALDSGSLSGPVKDLLKQFPARSDDELTNFANVHLQLQEAKQAVERLNTELEARVLERTAQLELEVRERQQAQEELLHLALHDPLTGLPNRMWLMERLSQELERSKKEPSYKFALLFLDGDRFKLVNDSLGHSVGDRLLVAVAERLRSTLPSKCHIARIGGDEFTILIESLEAIHQAQDVAQLLIDSLVQPFQLGQQRLFFKVSIGISVSDRSYDEPAQLLRDADIAMYEANASRQGGYQIFDGLMRQRTIERMQLETDLQQAIARNQLYLNYQPIIDLASGQLAGFEALVRWHHHDKGFIAPARFIPIAEETGLIATIDLWVLHQACQQMVQWQKQLFQSKNSQSKNSQPEYWDRGLPFKMGVNLSAKQFAQRDLIDRIDAVLAQTDICPDSLKLEITETALLDSPETAQMLLSDIKSRHIQLAIDDFGIGYSSLSYLHQFPVHTLKIDQSFVRKLDLDDSIEPIIRAMIDLAHNLNMVVIAEGIEEDFQRIKLKSFGCDLGQGYFFAKPLSVQQATAFIQQQKRRS